MKTREQTIQDQIDYIMDTFDFNKVKKAMDALDWTWASSDGIPEEYELRIQARELLNSTATQVLRTGTNKYMLATGGFKVTYDEGIEFAKPWLRINLQFSIDDSNHDGQFFSYAPASSTHQAHCNGTPYNPQAKWCSCGKSRF